MFLHFEGHPEQVVLQACNLFVYEGLELIAISRTDSERLVAPLRNRACYCASSGTRNAGVCATCTSGDSTHTFRYMQFLTSRVLCQHMVTACTTSEKPLLPQNRQGPKLGFQRDKTYIFETAETHTCTFEARCPLTEFCENLLKQDLIYWHMSLQPILPCQLHGITNTIRHLTPLSCPHC